MLITIPTPTGGIDPFEAAVTWIAGAAVALLLAAVHVALGRRLTAIGTRAAAQKER